MYVLSIVVFPFAHFSFGHCVVCSSIYGLWLSLWNLNLFLVMSRDLTIELLTISSANICKLSGLELKDILIQQQLIFNINEKSHHVPC